MWSKKFFKCPWGLGFRQWNLYKALSYVLRSDVVTLAGRRVRNDNAAAVAGARAQPTSSQVRG